MRTNVCFLHAPSIYDFREREIRTGPISDVVPSTPLFEMYPIGFLSMLGSLVHSGHSARISNLAVGMLSSKRFDVSKHIKKFDSDIFGIDLHWLPHAHGAVEISKIVKDIHPNSKVLLGGFSASYFKQEIMKTMPWVDFILVGDLPELAIVDLATVVEKNGDFSTVPNLVYRNKDGKIKENPMEKSADAIKRVFIDYRTLAKNTVKYGDILGHMPYYNWIRNPEAFTVIEHGCQYNCGFCGGSNFAYKSNYGNGSPLFRDPRTVAEEIELVHDIVGSPVFIAGDLNAAGEKFYSVFFREIKDRGIDIPLLTEYFVPPTKNYFESLSKVFPDFTAEISPESSNEKIRQMAGRSYSNHDLEKSILYAQKNGCKKFDLYFTIGIPGQVEEDVYMDIKYSDNLRMGLKSDDTIFAFISPLSPFLDPGSIYYEHPEQYGIKLFANTLKDYYNLLDKGKSWSDYLNYETATMSRKDIERITYQSGIRMIQSSFKLEQISEQESRFLVENIEAYIRGEDYVHEEDPSRHLTYLNKEIEWSSRHNLTWISVLIYMYKNYNSTLRFLGIRN